MLLVTVKSNTWWASIVGSSPRRRGGFEVGAALAHLEPSLGAKMGPSHCVIIQQHRTTLTLDLQFVDSLLLQGKFVRNKISLSNGNVPEWLMGTPRKRMASAAAVRIRSLSITFAGSYFWLPPTCRIQLA